MTTPNGQLPQQGQPAQQQPAPQPAAPQQAQPQQAQPQQQQITPQQANAIHDSMIGKAFKVLSGQNTQYTINPQTGQMQTTQVQNTPGQFFKNVVASALIGGAAGADSARENAGSPLAGVVKGGSAVINRNQQLDQQRIRQAQQEYKNQVQAQDQQLKQNQDQREAKNLQSEETLRKAQLASANAETIRTNQLTQGTDYTQHKEVADAGKQHFSDYDAAGLTPIAKDISETDMQEYIKNRPGASAYDWEPTGVKVGVDAKGQPTHEYTYTAYDPKGKIPVSKGTIDQWKKDGMDKFYPDLFNNVKAGRELDATQYIAIKKKDAQLYNDNLTRQKNDLTSEVSQAKIKESNAAAARDYASAAKDRTDASIAAIGKKQSEQFGLALQELDKVGGDFSKLKPSSKVIIGESTSKLIPALNDELKAAVADGDQPKAQDLMGQIDNLTKLTTGAFGGGGANDTGVVQMLNPQGQTVSVPQSKLQEALTHGYKHVGGQPQTQTVNQPLTPATVPEGLVILKGPNGQMEARPSENIGALKKDPKYQKYQIVGYGQQKAASAVPTPPAVLQYTPNK